MPDLCRSCHAPVLWAITEKGRWMPLDATPTADGAWRIFGDTPRAVYTEPARRPQLAATGQLHVAHWATCPHADEHRGGR